jgi:energy-converting hydrogenase Eha subunit G
MSLRKKHSKIGIASCLIAVAVWIYFGVLLYLFFRVESFARLLGENFISESRGMNDFSGLGTAIVLLALLFFFVPAIGHLLGFFLGVTGFLRDDANRTFPVVGVILNILPFVLGLIFYIFGGF